MCGKYEVCGKRHISKWRLSKKRRNHKGQFVQGPRTLTAIFLGVMFFGMVSMIGGNTIWGWAKSLEKNFVVENTKAEEVITITWQDEVKSLLKDYGVNVEYASKLIQCESSWNPKAVNHNPSYIDRYGRVVPESWDRGIFQINSYHHPEVSKTCAYDTACSTIEAIRIIKSKGFGECVCSGLVK